MLEQDNEQSSSSSSAIAATEATVTEKEDFRLSMMQSMREMVAEGFAMLDKKIDTKFDAYKDIFEGKFFILGML